MRSTTQVLKQWLQVKHNRKIPQQHMILLNNQIYTTYNNYDDALYDYNMLRQDPKNKIYLLKNYFISSMKFGDLDYTDDNHMSVTLRYDKEMLDENSIH